MSISNQPVDEVVIRRDENTGWRTEVPDADRPAGVFVTIVAHKQEALELAAQLYPRAGLRVVDDPLS